jgi:hypothetical protein
MVNDVIAAVSNALYEEFGKDYTIYADNVEQGLVRPSFFINIIRPAITERIMGRYHVSVPLVIQYFPTTVGKRTECYTTADRMFHCLQYPEYKDVTYRGTDLKFDINDDKLNFYVQYNFYAVVHDTDEVKPIMDDLDATATTDRKDDN